MGQFVWPPCHAGCTITRPYCSCACCLLLTRGHQVMVRFTNEISENALDGEQHWPCVGTRKGRPISQHLHGSASLAPYDGWADDVTCKGTPSCIGCYTAPGRLLLCFASSSAHHC
jgi:hypothetical protein